MRKYHRTYCKKSISPVQTRTFKKDNLYYYYVEHCDTNSIWVFEDKYNNSVGYRFYLKTDVGGIEHLFKEYFISEREAKLLKIDNKIV